MLRFYEQVHSKAGPSLIILSHPFNPLYLPSNWITGPMTSALNPIVFSNLGRYLPDLIVPKCSSFVLHGGQGFTRIPHSAVDSWMKFDFSVYLRSGSCVLFQVHSYAFRLLKIMLGILSYGSLVFVSLHPVWFGQ